MKFIFAFLLAASLLSAQNSVRGYAGAELDALRRTEEKLRAVPQPERIRTYMQRMSADPHHAGSPASKRVAEYGLGLFKEFGLDARIENYEALLPYPMQRSLELIEPVQYKAKLQEPVVGQDPDSSDANQLPTYNAYSGSGDVTAPLVYVNYGVPEDYEQLKKLGIDVKGKIVIARYGRSWRGTKPRVAYEHGAVGCIIYSDPRDDGYFQGDVYPKGAFRPSTGVQRGSVMDMPLYVGDPLSPGWASEPGSKRLSISEATTIMKIPVLPISYDDATPLLRALEGPVAPEPWRGALPFTYHIGPGPAKVRMKLEFDNTTKPMYNVIARIPGSAYPDEWIIYGNHHDAWVNGASDPVSGAAALLETARTLADLQRGGWRPKRTILLALWDGEEFGLLGSTEWVEKHLRDLKDKAVVYINSDSNGKGALNAGGSHTLEKFMTEILRDLTDPTSGKSLLEARRERRTRRAAGESGAPETGEFRLSPLGSGSDYTAFIHHGGIASINVGFGGESQGGIYHSIYDSFNWYTKFSDSDFRHGRALAQVTATMLVRLADASVLPFEFGAFGRTVDEYLKEIRKLAGDNTSKLELGGVDRALQSLRKTAGTYEQSLTRSQNLTPAKLAELNRILVHTERRLTLDEGLPGRPWYKNQIYAPGNYTGYSAKTLPGIREAVEAARWDEANRSAGAVVKVLAALEADIAEATRLLQ